MMINKNFSKKLQRIKKLRMGSPYCGYRPRQKVCARTPGLSQNDPECELVDNQCRVRFAEQVTQIGTPLTTPTAPAAVVPTEFSRVVPTATRPKISTLSSLGATSTRPGLQKTGAPKVTSTRPGVILQKEIIPKDISTVPEEYRVFLSGPVSAFSFLHNLNGLDVRFLFFGDEHMSMTQTCPQPCSDINIETHDYIEIPKCFDIVALLSTIYRQAVKTGVYTDTYLEYQFISKEISKGFFEDPKLLLENIKTYGYIHKIYKIFQNCFLKSACGYPTSRFHYTDIRFTNVKEQLHSMLTLGQTSSVPSSPELPKPELTETKRIEVQFDLIMLTRLDSVVRRMLTEKNRSVIQKEAEQFNQIMQIVYKDRVKKSQDYDLSDKLFLASLESDDYTNQVTKLIEGYLFSLPSTVRSKLITELTNPSVISKTDNKIQHRVRKQLYQLEQEGQGELAQKILDFAKEEYFQNALPSEIIKIWNEIYNNFVAFTRDNSLEALLAFGQSQSNVIYQIVRLVVTGSNIMDAYTLARLFRDFSKSKKPNSHVPSSVRIIYAGNNHILKYIKFFTEKLNVKINSYPGNPQTKRCLEVDVRDFLGDQLVPT